MADFDGGCCNRGFRRQLRRLNQSTPESFSAAEFVGIGDEVKISAI